MCVEWKWTEYRKKAELEKLWTEQKNSKINRMALNIFPPKTGKQPKSQALQLLCHQHILNPLGKQCVSHGCQHRTHTATATGYCHQPSYRGWTTQPHALASPWATDTNPINTNSCVPQTLNAAHTASLQHIQCVKVSNIFLNVNLPHSSKLQGQLFSLLLHQTLKRLRST